jgi:hypothetical protein
MRESYTLFTCMARPVSYTGKLKDLDELKFIEGTRVIPLCLGTRVRQCMYIPQWLGKATSNGPWWVRHWDLF